MRPPIERCLRLVDASGVDYALLHEPAVERAADLDLAVRASDLNRLEQALTSSYRIVRRARYEARSWGLAVVEREGPGAIAIAIDLTLDYRWGGRIFFSEDELLEHRRRKRSSWRLNEEQEWRYLLVKRFYEKRSLRAGDQRRMTELAAVLGGRAETAAVSLLGAEGARAVNAAAHSGDWPRLDGQFELLARAMARRTLLADPQGTVRYWADEAGRVIARLLEPSGLAVAALGPDGVGKTTLLDALESDLPGIFRRTLRFHFLPRRAGSRPTAPDRPHDQAPRGRILSALKAAYYALIWTAGWIARVAPARRATTAVLFDRSLDDLAVDPTRYRFLGPRRAAACAAGLLPRPDLTLVLDLNPARAIERKSETSRERLAALRRRYLSLGLERADVALIDASGVAAETRALALEATLEKLEERCGRLRPRPISAVPSIPSESAGRRGVSLALSGERRLWLPAQGTSFRGGLRALWRPLGRSGRAARALAASLPGAVVLGRGAPATRPFPLADDVFAALGETLGCVSRRSCGGANP